MSKESVATDALRTIAAIWQVPTAVSGARRP